MFHIKIYYRYYTWTRCKGTQSNNECIVWAGDRAQGVIRVCFLFTLWNVYFMERDTQEVYSLECSVSARVCACENKWFSWFPVNDSKKCFIVDYIFQSENKFQLSSLEPHTHTGGTCYCIYTLCVNKIYWAIHYGVAHQNSCVIRKLFSPET